MHLQVRLTGICNSRHMLINEEGIGLDEWSEKLEAGPLSHVSGQNLERQVLLVSHGDKTFLVGWPADAAGNLPEKTRKIAASWDS